MMGKDFDGDVAVKARVARVPHFAHTTSAEPRNDLVGTEACTRLNGRHKAVWIERGVYAVRFYIFAGCGARTGERTMKFGRREIR